MSENIIYSDDKGILRLFNGEVIYIVDIKYSSDGSTFLESKYNPFRHNYEQNPSIELNGHKYMHVKHAGDDFYQAPMYITATDGREIQLRTEDGYIQQGYLGSDSEWINLVSLSDLKGPQGDVGPQGQGLNIDAASWYGEFINSYPTPGCTTCNRTGETITDPWFVISLGDGVHEIVQLDVDNLKYRSDDGVTWISIQANDVGRKTRFIADDAIGTNYLDYRKTDTEYSSRGKVYVYSNGMWTYAGSISASNYLVAPSVSEPDNGKFMADYESETIGIDVNNNLEVKDDSIGTDKLKDGTFTHGLEEGVTVKVNPDEFKGNGIATYIADSDGEKHIQLDANSIISNGLSTESLATVDGEDNKNIIVNPSDLIDSTTDGLETVTKSDGYKDIRVKTGDALARSDKGVNVIADEKTINALDSTEISVRQTDNNTLGIRKEHINKDVVDPTKGLQKGDGTAGDFGGALQVKVDNSSIEHDANGNVSIKDSGVEGIHLNSNTVNTSMGIQLLANALAVKLANGGGLEFNTSGEILLSVVDFLTGNAVKSLNSKVNDVTLSHDNSAAIGSGISISVDNSGSGIILKLAVDENTLKSYLDISAGISLPISIFDVTDLASELDSRVVEGDMYDTNSFQFHPTYGPIWHSGTAWYKMTVTDPGNIAPVEISL